tara:strand:+ start:3459 stop:3569 length:111 start_codon:yes stop_codon:yes gene_type:complete
MDKLLNSKDWNVEQFNPAPLKPLGRIHSFPIKLKSK